MLYGTVPAFLRYSNLWKFSRIDEYLGWFADLLRLAGGRGDGPVGVDLVDPPVQLMQPGGREDVVLGPGVTQLVHRRPGLTQKQQKVWQFDNKIKTFSSFFTGFEQNSSGFKKLPTHRSADPLARSIFMRILDRILAIMRIRIISSKRQR